MDIQYISQSFVCYITFRVGKGQCLQAIMLYSYHTFPKQIYKPLLNIYIQ